jgi:hypothetical protein
MDLNHPYQAHHFPIVNLAVAKGLLQASSLLQIHWRTSSLLILILRISLAPRERRSNAD